MHVQLTVKHALQIIVLLKQPPNKSSTNVLCFLIKFSYPERQLKVTSNSTLEQKFILIILLFELFQKRF